MKSVLNRPCVDKKGNIVIPFCRLDDGKTYNCQVITPAIKELPLVTNGDNVFLDISELTLF